jgi:DNA-binding transcriptional MocR family regulator
MKKYMHDSQWSPALSKTGGPLYLAIADEIAADILAGRLTEGTRLPPQRTLADRLGIDFTTVSRAYTEARSRGLVEGKVGQGTYVRSTRPAAPISGQSGMVDLRMNLPPRFNDPRLSERMWSGIAALEGSPGLDLMLRYQEPGGCPRDRAAGAAWLAPRLKKISAERTLLCPGAQGALLAVTDMLAAPGDTILVEPLTYPGFQSLAAHHRIQLVSVPSDGDGPLPEAFAALCAKARPKAFYCNPTIQNPTARTIPLLRRVALAAVAREHGVPIIEDDAYGALPVLPIPPFADIAPESVFHIAGLAKCLSPALRIAYLVAPDIQSTNRLAAAIRASTFMASPLTAAIATRWIEDGTAEAVLTAIRQESKARQAIAADLLPASAVSTNVEGFHIWLSLTPPWTRGQFVGQLGSCGIGIVASDVFAIDTPPEAVRLALGAPAGREELADCLRIVADLLNRTPANSTMVI